MREVFQQELSEIKDRLVEISREVTAAITEATVSLQTVDKARARSVIAHDSVIDELSLDLDELAIAVLARQQPVARDLRAVVSTLRMSANLERMGDLAKHIAQVVTYLDGPLGAGTPVIDLFADVSGHTVSLAGRVTDLLSTEDVDLARKIQEDDDYIDEIHERIFAETLSGHWSGSNTETVNITLTNRYFERFGDHAVRIADKMVYLATGDWSEKG